MDTLYYDPDSISEDDLDEEEMDEVDFFIIQESDDYDND